MEALTNGLPQRDRYVNVLRDAMPTTTRPPASTLERLAGRCTRPPKRRRLTPIVRDLPAGLGRGADVLRACRPSAPPARSARVAGEGTVEASRHPAVVSTPSRRAFRCSKARSVITSPRARPFVRFACGEDLSHEPAESILPDAVAAGTEPFLVVGAMAGG
jgi:hypothetical protein